MRKKVLNVLYCGTMIHLGYDDDDEVVTSPSVKGRSPPLKNTNYYSSNEDY